MSLFSFFSRPAWQSRDAARRAEAVASDRNPALLAELPQILRNDLDARVRRAALERIDDLTLVADRMSNDADSAVRERARARLVELLVGNAPLTERRRALGLVEDQSLLELIAKRATEVDLRRAALEKCTRSGFIADRVLEDGDIELRIELLARVTQTPTLERLAAHARTRDKRMYRAIRERLDAGKAAAGESQTLLAHAEALCVGLEQQLRHPGSSAAAVLANAENEWPALRARIDERFDRRFEGAAQTLRATLGAIARIGEEPAEPTPEPVEDHADSVADSSTPAIAVESVAPAPPVASEDPDPTLTELLQRVEDQAEDLPMADCEALQRRWDSTWALVPARLAADQDLATRFRARIDVLRAAAQTRAATQERAREIAEAAIDAVATAVDAGQLAAARGARAQARAAIEQLPDASARALNRRLTALEPGLEKLSRWQRWSDNKVRSRLCDEAEALIGSGMHPDGLANKIADLKAAWKRIDDSELDPSAPATESGQAKRFRFMCHKALEPARGYFEKRKEVRGKRSEEVGAFLERARAELAAETTEIAALVALKRESGERLRRVDEVDPRQRGEIGKQLKQMIEACSTAIDGRFNAIAEDKQKLIAQLRRQLTHIELDAALDLAKSAQKRWQSLPKGSQKIDQALWQEFRQLIDPLFEKRNDELKAVDAEREAESAAARALVDDMQALAQSTLDATHIEAEVERIEAAWRQEANRPRELERSFDSAVSAAHAAANRKRGAELSAREQRAVDLAGQLDAIEVEWLNGADVSSALIEIEQALQNLDAVLTGALGRRLARLTPADEAQRQQTMSEQLQQAERLLLEYEFLASVDSPASEQSARMNLQVEKLAARMSSGQYDTPQVQRAAFDLRWWSTGPLASADRARLSVRRERALAAFSG
jgi:DNA repair protein SbcC/Rad50